MGPPIVQQKHFHLILSQRKRKNDAQTTAQAFKKANKPSPLNSKATHFRGRNQEIPTVVFQEPTSPH